MNLYKINQNIQQLFEMYEIGELDKESFEQAIAQLELMEEDKVDNTISYIKSLKAEVVAIKEEEKKLKERRQAKEKSIENLLEYLNSYMTMKNIKKFETPRHKLSFRKTPLKVVIGNVDEFYKWAEHFHRDLLKEKVEPNLTEIKAYIEKGNSIPSVELKSGQSLNIK